MAMSTSTAPTVIDREDDRYARGAPGDGGLAAAIAKLRGRLAARNRIQDAGLPLLALALATFVIGTAELVVVGVLGLIAQDLDVSAGTAGQLVTAYALGISIGGPLLTAMTIRLDRRRLLLGALALYLVGNVLAMLAASFGTLLLARAITGALHGLFIGVAFAVATSLVPPEKMGRAISAVFGGIAVSAAVGVPLGTLIGQSFDWQATFLAIVVLGALALAATFALVPAVPNQGTGGFADQARHAFAPPVLAVLAVGFLLLGGQFAALTYLSPYLAEVTGVSGGLISVFLLSFGAANAVGTLVGGRAADADASRTLVVANAVLVAALGGLLAFGSSPIAAALALAVWGLVGFGLVPSLQHRVVTLAGPGGDLAATLPASAVTAGIAMGAIVGGWALASGASSPIVIGLLVCAAALPASWATGRLTAPTSGPDQGRAR
jgi:DHA1 family inner membrane transport protein